ncbi:MAG: hypothetical protein EAZ53_01005 [Bacteroidetes bacterium]|nr:MAG: hypothetical protein EAZ53_01005 [Bacteroidota bacterium]
MKYPLLGGLTDMFLFFLLRKIKLIIIMKLQYIKYITALLWVALAGQSWGQNWQYVGKAEDAEAILFDGDQKFQCSKVNPINQNLYLAFQDGKNGKKTTVLMFNGSIWSAVGSVGISAGEARWQSLAFNSSGVPYVAYQDVSNGSKTTVLSFNGTNWGAVGSVGISVSTADGQSLAISNTGVPYVAYCDYGNGYKATVLSFNGTNWGAVGNVGISDSGIFEANLAFSPTGVPYICYLDYFNSAKSTVLSFNGANWNVVGSAGFGETGFHQRLAFNSTGTPFVCYKSYVASNVRVHSFSGSNWNTIGDLFMYGSNPDMLTFAISPSGIPHVAFNAYGNIG